MHPRGASVAREAGLWDQLLPAGIRTPNTFPSRHPRPSTVSPPGPRPGFPQVGSSLHGALTEVGLRTDRRTALSAPTASGPRWPRRPAPRPSPAGLPRAATPGPAPRSPPSRRRRLKAVGRPARVAGVRGPPAGRSARSEAIARRAGEEGRRRGAGPGRGRLYPRPRSQEAAPLPRRGRDSRGHVGGGGDARAGGLEGESQPHPALAPAAPPPRRRRPTLSSSAPRGAGQLPS